MRYGRVKGIRRPPPLGTDPATVSPSVAACTNAATPGVVERALHETARWCGFGRRSLAVLGAGLLTRSRRDVRDDVGPGSDRPGQLPDWGALPLHRFRKGRFGWEGWGHRLR